MLFLPFSYRPFRELFAKNSNFSKISISQKRLSEIFNPISHFVGNYHSFWLVCKTEVGKIKNLECRDNLVWEESFGWLQDNIWWSMLVEVPKHHIWHCILGISHRTLNINTRNTNKPWLKYWKLAINNRLDTGHLILTR